MASIWDERFETATTGYEETWSLGAVTGGGSAISPIIAPPGATPTIWATQCARYTYVAAQNCYIGNTFSAQNTVFISFDVNVTNSSLTNNTVNLLSLAQDGSAVPLWLVYHAVDGSGVSAYIIYIYYDGTIHQVATAAWPLATTNRFEIKWDSAGANDAYQVWVNGTSVASGALTGSAATRTFNVLVMGTIASQAAAASTFYVDLIRLDNAARASVDGIGGGAYQQQYYLSMVGTGAI